MTQEFSSPDWGAVPNVDTTGRTIPEFPTVHPSGVTWKDYFARMAAERKARSQPDPEEDTDDETAVFKDYGPVTIIRPAEENDEPVSALAAWVKTAHSNGWEILSIANALSFAKGKPYATGEKAGQPRPDYNVDTQWAHFKRGKDRASVIYTIINGTARGTRTGRFFNGERLSDAEMKRRMK